MKPKRFIKRLLPALLIIALTSLLACSQANLYFSTHVPHRWYGKWRVTAMFEAVKREDYETAWKYWDPKQEWSVERFKIFLQNGEISKVDDFEIVWIDIYDFKSEYSPWITVYVKINDQEPPLALHVEYGELIGYAAHSIYE